MSRNAKASVGEGVAWGCALLLLLLHGCAAVGPDFRPPEAPPLDRWETTLRELIGESAAGEAMELQNWWRNLKDPLLERLIGEAERNNAGLRQAGLRVLQARALLGAATAERHPQIRQGSGEALHTVQHGLDDTPGVSGRYHSYSLGFGAAWELDFWGKFRRGVEAADARFFRSLEAQRAMQVLVKAQVARLYLQARVLTLRIAIARKNAALQKRSLEIATELFHGGDTSELDQQQAKTQYLSTLATIPELERQRRQVLDALALTLGRAPEKLPELENDGYRLPRVPPLLLADIPSRLLLRRPDVRAAAWAVADRSARIGIAEADLYPTLRLLGSLGLSSSDLPNVPDLSFLSIGPSVTWNLFDQGILRNNVRLQDARLQEALERYREVVLNAAREVEDAAAGLLGTSRQERLLAQTVASAKRALAIANTRYREGYSSFQRVLDAQRALFAQEDRLVSLRGRKLQYLIELYESLGGGWRPATLDDIAPPRVRREMRRRTDWGPLLDAPLPRELPSPQPTGKPSHD